MFGMGFDVNGALIGMLQDGAAKVKTKGVTENGVYTAADEPVGQGEDKYDGYSVFTVNVTDKEMEVVQEYIFEMIYGHPYDPDDPQPGETPPGELTAEDIIEATGGVVGDGWSPEIRVSPTEDFNYKTYDNPEPIVITGQAAQDILDFYDTTGFLLDHAQRGYDRTGDSLNPQSETGESRKPTDINVAWCVYKVEVWATYVKDDDSGIPIGTKAGPFTCYMGNIMESSTHFVEYRSPQVVKEGNGWGVYLNGTKYFELV